MIIRIITAHMPDGTERMFGSRRKAARELGVGLGYISLMIKTGAPYCPTAYNGKKALIGMTMTEVVAVTQPVVRKKEKPLCLRCSHLYPFEAKEGMRYVCCLYGKRVTEEPEGCKGFQAGANKRQMEG
jgi:hypothetical protein